MVQVVQQFSLPRVPDLRTGAADVGDGEQIQRRQTPLGLHDLHETAYHLGIENVLLLGDGGHGEMVLHQKLHQLRVLRCKAMRAAETPRFAPAERGMVASAALGDVMKNGRDIQQPVTLQAAHEAAAQRIFVRMLHHGEAPQVPHHGEDVLVHGIDMEQVVLHLPHDAPEGRQIAAQDAVLVHAPQLVHDAARLLQDRYEVRLVHRIAPESLIDS